MVWFFVFTSLGVGVTLFLMTTHRLARFGWRGMLSGTFLFALLALLSRS